MIVKRTFCILLLFTVVLSCDEDSPMPGGPCSYNDFPGTGLIREIIADTLNETCSNEMIVYFDFTPDDPNAPDYYRFPNFPDTSQIFHLLGYRPPASWLEAQGLGVDSVFSCVRREIIFGTCSPYAFEFRGIDGSDWREYCEPPD